MGRKGLNKLETATLGLTQLSLSVSQHDDTATLLINNRMWLQIIQSTKRFPTGVNKLISFEHALTGRCQTAVEIAIWVSIAWLKCRVRGVWNILFKTRAEFQTKKIQKTFSSAQFLFVL